MFFLTSDFLSHSDIDVAVIGKWEDSELHWITMEKALIEKEMAIPGTLNVSALRSVKTRFIPIVKLTDKFTNIKVDITFQSSDCKKSSELIQLYSSKYYVLKV